MRASSVGTRHVSRLLAVGAAMVALTGTVGHGGATVPAAGAGDPRTTAPAGRAPVIHHELTVALDPADHRLTVTDTIRWPDEPRNAAGKRSLRFLLHAGLSPRSSTKGATLTALPGPPSAADFGLPRDALQLHDRVPVEMYELRFPPGTRSVELRYEGRIEHAPEAPVTESARSFSDTPGTIGPEGVFLSPGVRWYPWFGGQLVSFSMDVTLPAGWDAVAQGARTHHQAAPTTATRVRWVEDRPQDGITLAAARFTEYTRAAGGTTAMVFLRTPDEALANRYLDATVKYLETYSKMIGPYPYSKFALVENFWESGLGLPSYTLLGPTVLRLPFIIDTSYPHEILHSWWGNSVFVDETSGNWCEGLTAYQADYRLKEEKSPAEGASYRRDALQKYADFVSGSKDFPLTAFRERESPATEAVGYGKAMMLFHMLRRAYGDEVFLASLRRFYEKNRFRRASWSDLAAAFPASHPRSVSAKELIAEWTGRTGAPRLCIQDLVAHGPERPGEPWNLEGMITQIQPEETWRVDVPYTVADATNGSTGGWATFDGTRRSVPIRISMKFQPKRLALDPEFDLFRRIEREEIPAALSLAFGADTALAVLPSAEPEDMQKAYRAVAEAWARGKEGTFRIALDSEVGSLPADRTVWIFGWRNRFREAVSSLLAPYDAALGDDALRIGAATTPRAGHSTALVVPRPGRPELALAFVAADAAAAIPGLGRKLPHYAKYSYLTFEGNEPANTTKDTWPVVDSPLRVELGTVGSSRVDLQACKLEYSIVSPK